MYAYVNAVKHLMMLLMAELAVSSKGMMAAAAALGGWLNLI
jgi:hypothetical protein